jgi:hypothetical protein
MKALGQGSVASIVRVGLTIATIILWISLVFLVIGALVYAGLMAAIHAGYVDASILTGGDGTIRVGEEGGSSFSVTYDEPGGATWPVAVPTFLIGGVVIGGGLVIVHRLSKLFDSFTSGEPFRRENADHLRVIWIAMLVIEIMRYILLGLTGVLLAAFGTPEGTTARFEADIDLTNWLSIFVLIVLAEVFREGARLKEEQELTI